MHYYSVTFTAGKQQKKLGSKSPLDLEEFKKLVERKAKTHNESREANKGKRDPQGKPVVVKTFFGYEGAIDNVSVSESDRKKSPPADSPLAKLNSPAEVAKR
jgi:hypothetical protein